MKTKLATEYHVKSIGLFGSIGFVASLANLVLFISFALVNASVILLRYKKPDAKRTFKIPFNIGKAPITAYLGLLSSFVLFMHVEPKVFLYGGVLIAIGISMYFFKNILNKGTKLKNKSNNKVKNN